MNVTRDGEDVTLKMQRNNIRWDVLVEALYRYEDYLSGSNLGASDEIISWCEDMRSNIQEARRYQHE